MTLTLLHVIAISLLCLAFTRTLRLRRGRRATTVRPIARWTPPYAPEFATGALSPSSVASDYTAEAINSRRVAGEKQREEDNTEFIADLLAFRCKVCLVVYVKWLDAFHCHKGMRTKETESGG